MSEQNQNAQAQNGNGNKLYNIEGYIAGIKTGQTTKGETWMTFKLNRTNGKKPVSCKAFAKHADGLLENYGDGSAVRLAGVYRTETFNGKQDGKKITFQAFNVRWSGEPKYVGTELEGQPNEAQTQGQAQEQKEAEPAY